MARNEEQEQIALCTYIAYQYPDVIFNSDHSGIRVGKGLANKIKKLHSGNGIPDLTLSEPRGGYFGLHIEMKATGVKVFKKDGGLLKSDHLKQQYKTLLRLDSKGYHASFCCGFDEAKELVDWYMELPPTKINN